MRRGTSLAIAGVLAVGVPGVARAQVVPERDTPVLRPAPRREIVVEVPGERSTENKLLCGGLAAAGVVAGALGLYWHLDSRDAADAVAADEFTGRPWSADEIALVERADRSKTRAQIGYGLGGALLVAAVVTFIVTDPPSERSVIRTGAIVAPTPGGAIVGRSWSF